MRRNVINESVGYILIVCFVLHNQYKTVLTFTDEKRGRLKLLEVVRSLPLYQQVYNQLRKEITTGKLEGNSIINEVHLARDLEVSRGPVREAIRILEQEGLVIRDSNNQLRSYRATIEDLENIYQCRQVLESLSAKLAANRIHSEQVKKLKTIMAKKEKLIYIEAEGANEFADLCTEFHDIIIDSCGNPRLQQQIKQLKSLTHLYRQYNVKGIVRREEVYKEHTFILQLLEEENVEKAGTFMGEHIERDLMNLMTIYKSGKLG